MSTMFTTLRFGQEAPDQAKELIFDDVVTSLRKKQRKANAARWAECPKGIASRLRAFEIRATGKGLGFDLTPEWLIAAMERTHCEVTGIMFSGTGLDPFARTIDRFDNKVGYTQQNCKVVVWIYNSAKSKFSHEELMVLVKALSTTAA